ncbi:MAG TPA: amidohydrolase family protein, partial [Candidatus Angelobacter sp.]
MPSRKAFLGVMLTLLAVLGTNAVAQSAAQPKSSPASEKVTAIRAANLIDGTAAQVRHNVLIVIKGNKIESVTSGGNPPADAAVIDLPASVTVLPGLIDTHTHIFLQGEDPAEGGYDVQLLKHPSSYRAARAAVAARRALEQGFT